MNTPLLPVVLNSSSSTKSPNRFSVQISPAPRLAAITPSSTVQPSLGFFPCGLCHPVRSLPLNNGVNSLSSAERPGLANASTANTATHSTNQNLARIIGRSPGLLAEQGQEPARRSGA